MFMLTSGGGKATSTAPDVCQTPSPTGPMPVPYPNLADMSMADPGGLVRDVLVAGMPAMNQMSKVPMSNGDQAGAGGGVISKKIMGEMIFTSASQQVNVGGKPAVRVTCQTSHNAKNTQGLASIPGQTQVMVLG